MKIVVTILLTVVLCQGQAQNSIVLNADLGTVKINKHIYGHFSEHLGKCIYGGFYVGENNSKIPNTHGVRNDVVAALKKLKIANLRWPGRSECPSACGQEN